ncbi:GTP-binding ERG-like protein, partial [Trifolium medium]|nr:GTP-binding ERG-like protein [Trifolium medium]
MLCSLLVPFVTSEIHYFSHDLSVSLCCFMIGLTLNYAGFPYRDVKARVESAWSSVNLYEVLIVIFDVHRHIT